MALQSLGKKVLAMGAEGLSHGCAAIKLRLAGNSLPKTGVTDLTLYVLLHPVNRTDCNMDISTELGGSYLTKRSRKIILE